MDEYVSPAIADLRANLRKSLRTEDCHHASYLGTLAYGAME
jgi:hypothetical protein